MLSPAVRIQITATLLHYRLHGVDEETRRLAERSVHSLRRGKTKKTRRFFEREISRGGNHPDHALYGEWIRLLGGPTLPHRPRRSRGKKGHQRPPESRRFQPSYSARL